MTEVGASLFPLGSLKNLKSVMLISGSKYYTKVAFFFPTSFKISVVIYIGSVRMLFLISLLLWGKHAIIT